MPGARAVPFIDDITIILPSEHSLDMVAVTKFAKWLQERLGVEDISKSQALLANGVGPDLLTEEQRMTIDKTGLMVVR